MAAMMAKSRRSPGVSIRTADRPTQKCARGSPRRRPGHHHGRPVRRRRHRCDSPRPSRGFAVVSPTRPGRQKPRRGSACRTAIPPSGVGDRARIETGEGRLELDVRGDGGYVIAPGSVHATGALSKPAGDWTIQRDFVPRFWPGWLARPERQPTTTRGRGHHHTGNVVERARRYLSKIPQPQMGMTAVLLHALCRGSGGAWLRRGRVRRHRTADGAGGGSPGLDARVDCPQGAVRPPLRHRADRGVAMKTATADAWNGADIVIDESACPICLRESCEGSRSLPRQNHERRD